MSRGNGPRGGLLRLVVALVLAVAGCADAGTVGGNGGGADVGVGLDSGGGGDVALGDLGAGQDAATDGGASTDTATDAAADGGASTDTATDAAADGGASTDTAADTVADAGSDGAADTVADAGADADVGASTDTDAGASTDTAADTATDTAADTGSDTAADTGSDTATDTVADTGSDTVADTAADAATDTVADVVMDTASDADTDTAPDAPGPPATETACHDGVDEDEDGATDCADTDCAGAPGCEPGHEQTCDDGLDNDADGLTDCQDYDCNHHGDCEFGVEKTCNDGVDNDADGQTDCDDTNCNTCNGACCGPGWYCDLGQCKIQCPAGQLQCGAAQDVCCQVGELCLQDTCVQPLGPCTVNEDCPYGQICEPVVSECIPEDAVTLCEYVPPVGVLDPVVGCRWLPPAGAAHSGRDNVCMTPVVANLSDDNGDGLTNTDDTPDIAFTAWDWDLGHCCDEPATLWVASGACNADGTMTTVAEVPGPDLDESGGLAVGDLDGDGVPEIVGMMLLSGTVAFHRLSDDGTSWEVLWTNPNYPKRDVHTRGGSQPALADLDGDGFPEVIVGNVVLNGTDGGLRWDGVVTSGGTGGIGNNAFLGPVSIVADIDLAQPLAQEVIAGNTAYNADGTVKWTFDFPKDGYCQGSLPCDGFDAVGNFDDDDQGEVVIVREGTIYVLEDDGTLKASIDLPWDDCVKNGQPANESGPPTIADFDGDGRPEIGTAGADYYAVADLDCLATPLPAGCDSPGILWKTPNQDCSSRATASSVFDFEGDGKAEVVYADETTFRIFDGTTGAVLFTDTTHGSNTRVEMPVIADVDNDGSAEVVIPGNQNQGGVPGVRVWDDAAGNWVRSRRIWNEHSYHISNVSETGVVPAYETPNWLDPRYNNFRQNVQPSGVFWAPDLAIDSVWATCGADLVVHACVGNHGALGVPAGLVVTAVVNADVSPSYPLGTATTDAPILPGQCVDVTWTISPIPQELAYGDMFTVDLAADDDGSPDGAYNECDETNNAAHELTFCPY